MKGTVGLIFIMALCLITNTIYGQTARLTLNMKDATILDIFREIERTSDFGFFFKSEELNLDRRESIDVQNATIEEVLSKVLGSEYSYRILDRNIVITKGNFECIQQPKLKISGNVADVTGKFLPGVNVVAKGTTNGTTTDIVGNYVLDNVSSGDTLFFSFVGMRSEEIAVSGSTIINVVMQEETIGIEEVIAIGYGMQKKRDLTGSVSTITAKDFIKQPTLTPTDALGGRLAGVVVTNISGNVGAAVKIRIRGSNSINGGNDPLYVCDGVVGAAMPSVDEIESIEVLKDASATAIYGSRGANGVILITTKKAKEGITHLTMNGFGSFLQPVHLYDKLGAYEYAQEVNTLYNNAYSDEQLANFKNKGGTDWQREVISSAWRQKYNLAIDGGTKKVRYRIFSEYSKNTSLMKRQEGDGYTLRSNFNIELLKNLELEWIITGGYGYGKNLGSSKNEGGADAILFNALTWSPTESIYNEKGTYTISDQYGAMGRNPVQIMKEMDMTNKGYFASSNTALTWRILPLLSIQYRLYLDFYSGNNYEWNSSDYTQSYAEADGSKSVIKNMFQNLIINWNKSYGNHTIGITAVGEATKYTYESLSGIGKYFGTEKLEYWGMGSATTQISDVNWSDWSLLSGIGRLTYNYGGKYYLTGAFRADGSSKFAKGNRWGYFQSGSIAWRLSEEDFVKDLSVFSNLKIRASYGKTGNQGVGPYSTIASLSEVGAYYMFTSRVYGYTSKAINQDLKWEETGQADLGLDAGFFNGRLNLTMDYYQKDTRKLLLSVTTPYFLGGDDIYQNKGEVTNKGFEFSVDAIPVQNEDLSWTVQFNFATNKNKIVNLGGEVIYGLASAGNNDALLSDETYILREGLPLGCLYGYKWLGIWQEDQVDEAARYGNKPGDNRYADLNNDGSITANDRTNIGNGIPSYTWGYNSTLKYRRWDLNILLQGVHGNDMLNVMYALGSSLHAKSRTITLKDAWENSWTETNKSNKFPSVTSETSTNYVNSTHWLQNASFIRIKNLSLGYTFDKKIMKIGECHIYVNAQNLFTFTDYKGYDPEATSTLTGDVCTGIDSGITPSARTFTVGAQLSF